MTSIEAKERGAAAWLAQDFNLAVTHYSTAIEIGGDKDFLKVLRHIILSTATIPDKRRELIVDTYLGRLLKSICG